MSKRRDSSISRRLSLALRHRPDQLGLILDAQGYARVSSVLGGLSRYRIEITREDLERIVLENDKQRFAFSSDGAMIRANQGHSVEVELGYDPAVPPVCLYHGTALRHLESIQDQGLLKRQRHHVHLAASRDAAYQVGARHGAAFVLEVNAGVMHVDGYGFCVSPNGVWLTDHVPPKYLRVQT